jgi:hypothetical protein
MAKTKTKKAVTKEVAPKEEVIKEVAPSIEEVGEAVAKKDEELEKEFVTETSVYDEVKLPLDPPVIEVEEEDLTKYEPDTIDHFAVFAKAKDEKGGKVWVKDHTLLRKVEGRQFTLGGTQYLGELLKSE